MQILRFVAALAILSMGCASERAELAPAPLSSSSGTSAASAAPQVPSSSAPDLASANPAPALPRIYSKRRHVWIYPNPSSRSQWIGFLGLGGSVALRDAPPVRGDGCSAFHPVQPRGWVCLDERTTLDPADRELTAITRYTPRWDDPFPYSYGEAKETPRYWTIPSYAEQKRREWNLDGHLALIERMRNGVAAEAELPAVLRGVNPKPAGRGVDELWSAVPRVHEFRLNIPAGSSISWIDEFDAEGRTWLVTGDLALVPKDKVAPYPRSDFHGTAVEADKGLAVAWVRGRPRPRHRQSEDGSFRPDGEWPRLSRLALTGKRAESAGRVYLETADAGFWIDERQVAMPRSPAFTPWGEAVPGATDTRGAVRAQRPAPPAASRRTWIDVDVHGGWLVAYEGTRPVYATMISPGRGRTLRAGDDELVESATPPGVYDVLGKYMSSTMAVTAIVHFDVTFAMPFFGTYALHTSYSHDRWGEKKSLGCVNLSPRDAQWLFRWAEPDLPDGWFGASFQADSKYRTIVVVR